MNRRAPGLPRPMRIVGGLALVMALAVGLATALALTPASPAVAQIPPRTTPTPAPTPPPTALQPMSVSGTASLNAQPPPVGAILRAFGGTTLCGPTTVTSGRDQPNPFALSVNSLSQQAGCGTNGAPVSFTINALLATPSLPFASGGTAALTLTASASPSPPPPSSSPS